MVAGLPGGIIGLGTEAVQSAAGFPRLAVDVGANVLRGRAPGEGFSTDYGTNLGEYFPLLEQFRESGMRTGYRVTHPGDYAKASREGNLVGAVVEDAANLSIVAGPAAKLAGAGAGRVAVASGADAAVAEQVGARAGAEVTAKAAADAGVRTAGPAGAKIAADTAAPAGAEAGAAGAAEATGRVAPRGRFQPALLTPQRFPRPSTLVPEQVARPGMLRVAQGIERIARPAEEVAGAPARVWTAPLKLAKGVELPRFLGTTAEGARRRVGLKPILDRTGVTRAVMEQPQVAAAAERFGDWRAERAMKRAFRQEQLLPGAAEVHQRASDIQRDLGPAMKVLGEDPTLMYATHLLTTGMRGVLDVIPRFEERVAALRAAGRDIPPDLLENAVDRVVAESFGLTQGPAREVTQTVLDYHHGTLDPVVRERIDRAMEMERRPIEELQEQKIAREQLHPEQVGNVPMEHRVEAITGRTRERIQTLKEELEGYDVRGEHVPGLLDELAAAQAQVPRVDLPALAGQRQQAASRRAGATEAEASLAARQAEAAYREAERAAGQADRARAATLQGAREEMGQLHREQYGMPGYEPEFGRAQLEAGRAERAAGTGPFTVPEAEYQLAERLARLEGEGRTAGVEQQAPRAAAATERAAAAGQRGAGAEGRIFTAAAEPVYRPENALPFGELGSTERRMFEPPPPPDAPITREHRAEVVRARDDVARAAQEARIAHSDRLAGIGAGIRADGTPTIGYMPDYWRTADPTFMQQQHAGARSQAQREAALRRRRYGERTDDWMESLSDDEWKMVKRHMRKADPNDLAAADDWASQLANTEGRVRDEVSTDMAAEAMVTGLKRWENASDIAAGVRPRWPEELADTMGLSVADEALVKALPERGSGAKYRLTQPTVAEAEAMVRAHREGRLGEHAIDVERMLPEARLGPSPWAMTVDEFRNELVGVQEAVQAAPDEYFDWTPEQLQAEQRLAELVPGAVGDMAGLTEDQIHDRVRQAAQLAGKDVPDVMTPLLAAGEAGRGAVRESRAVAQEAFELDQGAREFAAANNMPPPATQNLARTHLLADEQRIYDAIASGEKAEVAGERLGEARTRLTAGLREEGERAGQRVGEPVGAERVLSKQAAEAEARAETLEPRIPETAATAQAAAEAQAGTAVRFGERRGKRQRVVLELQRQIRTKEGRMKWLEEEVLPTQERRLAEGPKEVAPGKYAPALMTAERMSAALQRMGDALVEATGDPWMSGAFWDLMGDLPTTMEKLHAKGIYPEYLPGAVDRPTKGAATMAGGQEQMPWFRAAPSAHQKRFGHVPQEIRTVHRSLVNDIRVMVEQDTARKVQAEIAVTGRDVIAKLVERGELEQWKADVLLSRNRAPEDFAKRMEEHGFSAWDPEKPRGPTDRQVTADSYFVPTPIYQEFLRWWKPANTNGAIRVYDNITRGFKHGVLAMSPTWHTNNILGNAFMAVVFGGESPAAIYRATRDVLREMRAKGREARAGLPEPIPSEARLSRAGRAVVNRVGPLRRVREWGRDIGAAPPIGPPRLYGAGGAAEITRQFAEMTPPRTAFGRGLQGSYRVNEFVDNVGRTMLHRLKMAKGYDSEQAVGLALQAMGDFHNMSYFEREYVRRVIPFYAWMRHITRASVKLAVEHPWRTAWMMHLSNVFNPKGQDTGVPEWLRGGLGVGGGWYVPFGGANPLQGSAGSIFTSPKQWPAETLRSLNPVIKTAAGAVGINLSQARAVTRPPGTGPLTQYGQPMWSWQAPNEMAYMALRQLPQGRLLTDLVYNPGANEVLPEPVLRYDTGQVIKRKGRPIPQTGGRFGGVVRNLNVPFFPTYVNEAEVRARIAKGERAAARARATYNR